MYIYIYTYLHIAGSVRPKGRNQTVQWRAWCPPGDGRLRCPVISKPRSVMPSGTASSRKEPTAGSRSTACSR